MPLKKSSFNICMIFINDTLNQIMLVGLPTRYSIQLGSFQYILTFLEIGGYEDNSMKIMPY